MDPTQIQLPVTPCVILWDGRQPIIVMDDFTETASLHLPPISRAVTVARLRALADVLEGTA